MAWTDLSFPFGSTLSSSQMTQLDDNFDALAAKDAGAPVLANDYVVQAMIAAGAVGQSEIGANAVGRSEAKTGTASTAGSISNGAKVNITLNAYSFFPMIHSDESAPGAGGDVNIALTGHGTDGGVDSPRFGLANGGASSSTYDVSHRYITS